MIRKTIGGDRLGSGNKMTADMRTYERSTHDLGYIWRSTMASGTLVPFLKEVALPGDTWDIGLQCEIMTHPTLGPLFGSYKVQLDVFQAPIRLYQGVLHNNRLNIGMNMSQVKLPLIELTAPKPDETKNMDNQHVNPSALLAYLDIRGIRRNHDGVEGTTVTGTFNAVPYLAYWEIYKNYYANKQEEIGAYIHQGVGEIAQNVSTVVIYDGNQGEPEETLIPSEGEPPINYLLINSTEIVVETNGDPLQIETLVFVLTTGETINANELFNTWVRVNPALDTQWRGENINRQYASKGKYIANWRYIGAEENTDSEPKISTFPLSNIDEMKEKLLAQPITSPFVIKDTTNLAPYSPPLANSEVRPLLSSQEGLGLKTYQSDLLNNWMSTEWIDGDNGISAVTAIDTSGGEFTIDTLNLSKKVYDMLNRIAISGGSYNDWIETVYTNGRYTQIESPVYHGGLIKELVFQEVISNSSSEDQPLGTLAGRGALSGKHKGGQVTIHVDEPSYIIGIVSLTPRVDYSQGNKWDIYLETMDDLHKPALDEIGFQDLLTRQMAWWDSNTGGNDVIEYYSAGKQPAWINYMTNVNVVRGNFAIEDNEMFMTLNRRYERDETTGRIKDLTTYIDPVKFNHIFAQTSRDAQNFWTQIGLDMTVRRKMSAKIMPNL